MRSQSRLPNFHTHTRPPGARWLGGFVKFCLVVGLVLVAAWLYFQSTVRSKLAQKIEQRINQLIGDSGLQVSVGQAQFVDGKGIVLNNLAVHSLFPNSPAVSTTPTAHSGQTGPAGAAGQQPPIVEFYDAFVHLPVCMTDMVMRQCTPQGIDIRRARLNLVRKRDGQWELEKFVSAFKPKPGSQPIPVSIRDSEIRIVDNTRQPPLVRRLTDVQVDFQRFVEEGRELTRVTFRCSGTEMGRLHVTVLADTKSGDFDVHFNSQNTRLSPALFALLPDAVSGHVAKIKTLTGTLETEGRVVGNLSDAIPQYMVTGALRDFAIDDARLPAPLTRASASFLLSNDDVRVTDAGGRIGDGTFRLNYQQDGLLERKVWQLSGMAKRLKFHHVIAMSQLFPKGCTQFCDDFSPTGECDLNFRLGHNGQSKYRQLDADLRDTSFRFVKFPYFVDQCEGRVELRDNVMALDLKSLSTPQPMTLKGNIYNPGIDATYHLDLSVPGEVPIDEKLLKALDAIPPMARVVRAFHPTGWVGGKGTIIKRIPRGSADKYFDVDLKGVAIRHEAFAYPIRNITGMVSAANLDFEFRNLVGSNGNGNVQCRGKWDPREGLISHFECRDVNLDDQLAMALSPDLQAIWNGFRPRGTVAKMGVEMTMPVGHHAVNVVVDADLQNPQTGQSNVSIFPHWFPYEIKNLGGNVRIGDGEIEVAGVSGKHGRTWLACEGNGRYSDESWSVTLGKLLATSVSVDEDLLTALPTSLAPPVRQMKYKGLLNVQGEITVAGVHQDSSVAVGMGDYPGANYFSTDPTMAWDLNFAMNNAKMLVGLPLESVFGTVQLQGIYDGKRAECKGELEIDSLSVYGAQITDVKGPIWMDNDRVSAGGLVQPPAGTATGADSRSADSLTGTVYGGLVKFDATMANDTRGQFYIQTTMADGDIEEACRDFAPEVKQVQGRGFVAMRMGGNYDDFHSYRGDGTVQLRDARIYELPAMLTLLKMLNVGRTDRSAFDASNVNFMINGTDIDFERIELVGDAISLIGNGRMNLDQDLDLNFYSIVGRNRIKIPVLNELYHVGSQQIMWISVDGTMSNPKMSRQVLPHLNDSIRQLFQSPIRENSLQNRPRRTAGLLQPAAGLIR